VSASAGHGKYPGARSQNTRDPIPETPNPKPLILSDRVDAGEKGVPFIPPQPFHSPNTRLAYQRAALFSREVLLQIWTHDDKEKLFWRAGRFVVV